MTSAIPYVYLQDSLHCFERHSTMTPRCALMVAIVLAALVASVESAAKPSKKVRLESLEEVLERMMREGGKYSFRTF